MIGLEEMFIVLGVFALAGTYLLIVHSFIRSGERDDAPTRSVPRTAAQKNNIASRAINAH